MVADDLALSSKGPAGMQNLVNEAQLNATRERSTFSKTKTKTMDTKYPDPNSTRHTKILLNDVELEHSDAEKHLGLIRKPSTENDQTIADRVVTARRTAYSLMGAGLHGLHGVGPEVGRHIYLIYVLPRLTDGLEALILKKKDIAPLDLHLRTTLRYLQHLPKSTATPAIHLLSGVLPVEAYIHIDTLTFFRSTISRAHSIERQLIERQLVMKSIDDSSWVSYVRNMLSMYKLPSAFTLLENPPSKDKWRITVKKSVSSFWKQKLVEEATTKTTLSYINFSACRMDQVHPCWKLGAASNITVLKASNKAKLLTQRYPLFYSRTSGTNYGHKCPVCKCEEETLKHFLLSCEPLSTARNKHMSRLNSLIAEHAIVVPHGDEAAIKLILDPSHYAPAKTAHLFEAATRDLCFALHDSRCRFLDSPITYSSGSRECNVLQRRPERVPKGKIT